MQTFYEKRFLTDLSANAKKNENNTLFYKTEIKSAKSRSGDFSMFDFMEAPDFTMLTFIFSWFFFHYYHHF